MQYGEIPIEKLHLVRSMSFAEFKNLVAAPDGVIFSAQSNTEKAAAGQPGGKFLEALGFEGKERNSRNTVHFCLNALVNDHVNGKFDREVIAIAPLGINLGPSGPSSFMEIDVAFPYRAGQRTFQGMTFLISEEYAGAAAEHARATPGAPAFETFKSGEAVGAVSQYLIARGAPVKEAGWYAWKDSENTGARHAETERFVTALSEHCGHKIPKQLHAAVLENSCEVALAKVLESSYELFQGRQLYKDQGVDLEHYDRIKLLTTQLRMCDAKHPDTRAYIQQLLPVLDAIVACSKEFKTCLNRYRAGDVNQVDRMFELAPALFHAGLEKELTAFKDGNPIFPPPMSEMEVPTS
ncbi:hypothetical protein [Polaromonas sp.]|uniref:hypothetical protein n=1 Tax=Polaromonas sp. TaxID=1869339 RepID=UPI00352B5C05